MAAVDSSEGASEGKKRKYENIDEVEQHITASTGCNDEIPDQLDLEQELLPATSTNSSSTTPKTTSAASVSATTATGTTTVYVGGVPNQYCTESVLEKIMSRYGTIVRCSVVQKHDRPHKFCFCEFATAAQAAAAIQHVDGRLFGGQRLIVRPATSSSTSSSGFGAGRRADTHLLHHSGPSSSSTTPANSKRQAQQITSRIEAIQRKLAAKASAEAAAKR
jgi:RNA recognition motif-containing protein